MLHFVDPARVNLGGRSTGGALVPLVAESSDRFRAVGSVGYGPEYLPCDFGNPREIELRSPGRRLATINASSATYSRRAIRR